MMTDTTRDGDVLTATFGNYLRTQRKRAGFTQRELADKVGVDFTYISKLENNAAPVPSIQTLRRMADAFHITDAQMCAAAGRLDSDLSKQELELYTLQLLKVHENTMEENRALQQRLDAAEQRAERLPRYDTTFSVELEMGEEGGFYINTPLRRSHPEGSYVELDTTESYAYLYEAFDVLAEFVREMTFEDWENLFYKPLVITEQERDDA